MKKLYSLFGALALAVGAHAAISLPKALYTLDFEGATQVSDFGGIQHGSGEIKVSNDVHFGTYYQNMEGLNEVSFRTNFLEVPTDVLSRICAKDTKTLSVGFWVNAKYANEKNIGNYWGPLFNCYTEGSVVGATWPQALEVRYGGQIHGNANGTWYDNNHNSGTSADGSITYDQAFMESIMQWSVEDPEKPDFEDNWHYFTTVYTEMEGPTMNFKLYIDGELKIDCNEVLSGDANLWIKISALDRFCIGGNSFNWNDPDNAYAYDDVALYADALTQEQIQIIIDLKRGNLTPEVELIIARGQLEDMMDEATDFASTLVLAGVETYGGQLEEYAMEIDPETYDTVDDVNTEIAILQGLMDDGAAILNAYEAAKAKMDYYQSYADQTIYPGYDDFTAAFSQASEDMADPQSVNVIDDAMAQLETAKVAYVFSQEDDVINVTRVIDKPWFVNEPYEPTISEDGDIEYGPDDEVTANLNLGNWQMPIPEELKGSTDFQVYYTNGRTTANLYHNSTVAGAKLNLYQTITGLPVGYYDVSADMASSAKPTDNHAYAISGGYTKVSPIATNLTWHGTKEGAKDWETLTTDKVYVGEDGTMTIGTTSTTNGLAYEGWYCATNFQLRYYGPDYDMTEDYENKKAETIGLIDELQWGGDITMAQTLYNGIVDETTMTMYQKISELTSLITTLDEWIKEEQGFTLIETLTELINNESNEAAKAVLTVARSYVNNVIGSSQMSVAFINDLNALYGPHVELAATTKAASEWGSADATTAANNAASALAAIEEQTPENIGQLTASLIEVMKATITDFPATLTEGKEITALVGNASFDQDQYAAWTIEGTCAVQQAEIEFYNNSFDMYQTITDLPKGTYRLTASGFYRDGNDYRAIVDNYWTPNPEGKGTIYDTRANAKLYAVTGGITRDTTLVSIASDSLSVGAEDDDAYRDYYGNENHISTDFTSNDKTVDPVIYYPYWMWNAYHMITNLNLYGDNEVWFVIEEEKQDVTIGVKKEITISGDWTIADKFRLFYHGQEAPEEVEEITDATPSVPVAYYTIGGAQVQKPVTGIYIVKYANGKTQKQAVK